MSAQGSAPRATLDIKVRVWGMGSNNQPFFQNAMARVEGRRRDRRAV
jgi:hypothetical protein